MKQVKNDEKTKFSGKPSDQKKNNEIKIRYYWVYYQQKNQIFKCRKFMVGTKVKIEIEVNLDLKFNLCAEISFYFH